MKSFIITTYLNESAIKEALQFFHEFFHDAHEADIADHIIQPLPSGIITPQTIKPPVNNPPPRNPAPNMDNVFFDPKIVTLKSKERTTLCDIIDYAIDNADPDDKVYAQELSFLKKLIS
jgi:hypothetical protein